MLKTKRFKTAAKTCTIAEGEGPSLANSLLVKGKAAREQKLASAGETFPEMLLIVGKFSRLFMMC